MKKIILDGLCRFADEEMKELNEFLVCEGYINKDENILIFNEEEFDNDERYDLLVIKNYEYSEQDIYDIIDKYNIQNFMMY